MFPLPAILHQPGPPKVKVVGVLLDHGYSYTCALTQEAKRRQWRKSTTTTTTTKTTKATTTTKQTTNATKNRLDKKSGDGFPPEISLTHSRGLRASAWAGSAGTPWAGTAAGSWRGPRSPAARPRAFAPAPPERHGERDPSDPSAGDPRRVFFPTGKVGQSKALFRAAH